MTRLADSMRDVAYATVGVQILTYDRIAENLDRRFDLRQRAAVARDKAAPTFERLTRPAEGLVERLSPSKGLQEVPAGAGTQDRTPRPSSGSRKAGAGKARKPATRTRSAQRATPS
jgi:hypothetical protein